MDEEDVTPNTDFREKRIEIFEPWYYGLPTRPFIKEVNGVVKLGKTFVVQVDKPSEISRVAIIRNGSVTHGFNGGSKIYWFNF